MPRILRPWKSCGVIRALPFEVKTEVLVWKVRFKFNGQTGFANLKFDPSCGRFRDGTNIDVIADELRNINWGEPSAEEFEF